MKDVYAKYLNRVKDKRQGTYFYVKNINFLVLFRQDEDGEPIA